MGRDAASIVVAVGSFEKRPVKALAIDEKQ